MLSNNRTILITGATSGIGYQAALRLLSRGNNLIILCKDKLRREEIYEKLSKNLLDFHLVKERISMPIADLSDLQSIDSLTSKLISKDKAIDSLILNAGLQYTGSKIPRWSSQKIELTFAVNHLSHHFLTVRLLEMLLKSKSPKVIVTSSEVHNPESPGGRIGIPADLGNLDGLKNGIGFKMVNGKDSFSADKAYKDSKLCNVLFSRELARRISLTGRKVPVICWAPGLVIPKSNDGFFRYSRKYNEVGQRLFSLIARDILQITETPEKAGELLEKIESSKKYQSEAFIYLSNQLRAFSNHKLSNIQTSSEGGDMSKAIKLWELSTQLIKNTLD